MLVLVVRKFDSSSLISGLRDSCFGANAMTFSFPPVLGYEGP